MTSRPPRLMTDEESELTRRQLFRRLTTCTGITALTAGVTGMLLASTSPYTSLQALAALVLVTGMWHFAAAIRSTSFHARASIATATLAALTIVSGVMLVRDAGQLAPARGALAAGLIFSGAANLIAAFAFLRRGTSRALITAAAVPIAFGIMFSAAPLFSMQSLAICGSSCVLGIGA